MGEREELHKRDSEVRVQKNELEKRLRELEGIAGRVNGLREPPQIVVTSEKLAEIESIRAKIDELNAKQKEILQKIQRLPRQQR